MKTTSNKALWALGITLVLLVATGAGDFDPTIVVDAWIVVSPDVTLLNITANATDAGQINASNGHLNYTIYNVTGHRVTASNIAMLWNGSLWNATNVDISSLSAGDYYVCVNATNASSGNWSYNNTNWFAVGDLVITYAPNYANSLNVTVSVDALHDSGYNEDLNFSTINGDMNYTLYYRNGTLAQSQQLVPPISGHWEFYVTVSGDYYAVLNATHYNLRGSNITAVFAVGTLDVVPQLNTSNPLNVSLRVGVTHGGEVLNDTNINGDANYTLYYTNDSVAGSGSLIYSNGYWRAYVDHAGDFYATINATHYNLEGSNSTVNFAVG
ncbi:MAG: hypothetical protein U9Q92_06745, partial [archaeon]|nr:hypothetical protein [archaeon]